MTREALADRIVTYSDAVVAFSVVNAFAFVIALGEPDIRCSIAGIVLFCVLANLVFAFTSTGVLVALRRLELRLRTQDGTQTGGEEDELIDGFWRLASRVRIGLVWFFSAIVFGGMLAATRDTSCLMVAP